MATTNSARARILDRIRKAQLRPDPEIDTTNVTLELIFGPIGDAVPRFLKECAANLTEVKVAGDRSSSLKAISELLATVSAGILYVQDDPALRQFSEAYVDREVMWSTNGRVPEDCAASITLCEGLVAQTGSILSSSRCGGRGGSIISPVHIVYATSDQLMPDITTALRKAIKSDLKDASYFGLISGSSRTADIEKILVQGAHGPVKVAIVLEMR
jgi:L-lactate dehydrogenase complex protein LldG